jgi:GxxExxY protein
LVDIDIITGDVLNLAIRIHRALGPGMLETVYEQILAAKLRGKGYHVDQQVTLGIEFEDVVLERAFKIDLLVDQRLLIEIKSVASLVPAHSMQMLTYLRLSKRSVGLLINFGGEKLTDGYKRLVNEYRPSAISASSAPSARTRKG